MGIFLIVPLGRNADRLATAVSEKFPEPTSKHPLQNDAGWLISYNGTTSELSNFIGITGQPTGEPSVIGSAIVTPVPSYFGRGSTDMWEWLKARFESQ